MITKILGSLALSLPLVAASSAYAIDFESDVPAEVANQTRADLSFVEGITAQQSSPMHMGIFGKVNGPGYMQWFGERISTFGYDANEHSGAIAYNDSMWNPNHIPWEAFSTGILFVECKGLHQALFCMVQLVDL